MNIAEFISPDTIRVKCADKCGDSQFKRHLPEWYMQTIRDALDLLAFETFFDKGRYDDLAIPDSLIVNLPKTVYSISNVYVFDGDCHPEDAVNVYWKVGFNNQPDGQSYTAPRTETNNPLSDPFMPNLWPSLAGLADGSFTTQSAMRFNYDTDQFTVSGFPIDNIRITKNSNIIDSGVLNTQADVDLFFESHGWTKVATYKYKYYASPDIYATPFVVTIDGTDTNVTISYTSYINDVGLTTAENDNGTLGVKWANLRQTDKGLQLMLSQSCAGKAKVRIEYCGTYGSFEEIPCIPRFIRDAVEDFVCMEHGKWQIAIGESPAMFQLYKAAFENPITGSLYRVTDRVANMSEWERKNFNLYLSRGNW